MNKHSIKIVFMQKRGREDVHRQGRMGRCGFLDLLCEVWVLPLTCIVTFGRSHSLSNSASSSLR